MLTHILLISINVQSMFGRGLRLVMQILPGIRLMRNLSFLLFLGISPGSALAQDGGPASIVYKIYGDYAWEALFSDQDEASKFLGKSLLRQPKSVLVRYFDDDLASLLVLEESCVEKNPGELCNLDFNPIFASQDVSASELSVNDVGDGRVDVRFYYPSNNKKMVVSFLVKKTGGGWRIFDIFHENGGVSLKKILSR
ncbi:DUF3828 domain-containing protein [Ralstonia pseudosolanacearum]